MSLYLCVFDDDQELDGWVFGHYSDFGYFRDLIKEKLAEGKYPVLLKHSDCDGQWSADEVPQLKAELWEIAAAFRHLPAAQPREAFEHTASYRKDARSLYDCFHNVDGENVFEALISLCDLAIQRQKAIQFQ